MLGQATIEQARALQKRFVERHGVLVVANAGLASGLVMRVTPALEGFDDEHALAAVRAWRAGVIGFDRLGDGNGRGDIGQFAGRFEMRLANDANQCGDHHEVRIALLISIRAQSTQTHPSTAKAGAANSTQCLSALKLE